MFQTIPSGNSRAIQLFCIAHAGGGPSAFRGWAKQLSPEIEAILIELPGREGRFDEPAYRSIEPLVRDLSEATLPYLDGNRGFAYFGNSVGAFVAFETVHEIKRRTGREPMHLFVSASRAPHIPFPMSPIGELPDEELVRETSSRYDGIPPAVLADREFLSAVLPTLRADIQVAESYVEGTPRPLDCPITAFGGLGDRTVPVDHVEGWKHHTRSAFSLILLEENHLYLQSARNRLTETIRETLLNASCAL